MSIGKNWLAGAALAATMIGGAVAASVLLVDDSDDSDDSDGTLGKVDVATGAVTVVGQMQKVMTDIAFDPSGNLWGITVNQLFKIDKTTAATAFVGSLGTTVNSLTLGADGTLYAANTSLFKVNTGTGAATLVGSVGGYGSSDDLC